MLIQNQYDKLILLKIGLLLMKNVLTPLAKCLPIPIRLTAAAAAAAGDARIHQKIIGSRTKMLTISNEEMNDINKMVKSLEDSGILLKMADETVENKKEQ